MLELDGLRVHRDVDDADGGAEHVSAPASVTTSQASAGRISEALRRSRPTTPPGGCPHAIVSQPESGIATNEPAPSPAIAAPSAAGDSASASCTCGIREAQRREGEPAGEEQPADGDPRRADGPAVDEAIGDGAGIEGGHADEDWGRLSRNDPASAGGRRVRANP